MSHRLKKSKGKRGRGGGGAAGKIDAIGGVRSTAEWGGKHLETRTTNLETSGSHHVCARRVVAGGRQERTSFLHGIDDVSIVQENTLGLKKQLQDGIIHLI